MPVPYLSSMMLLFVLFQPLLKKVPFPTPFHLAYESVGLMDYRDMPMEVPASFKMLRAHSTVECFLLFGRLRFHVLAESHVLAVRPLRPCGIGAQFTFEGRNKIPWASLTWLL